MKDSLKFVGYVFMEIPSGILLADIFARTIYWRSSMQNLNLFVMVREYLLEWIISWGNNLFFGSSCYLYLEKKPNTGKNPLRRLALGLQCESPNVGGT